jgi:hypothetical protein
LQTQSGSGTYDRVKCGSTPHFSVIPFGEHAVKVEELELILSGFPTDMDVSFTLGGNIAMNSVLVSSVKDGKAVLELCNVDANGVTHLADKWANTKHSAVM